MKLSFEKEEKRKSFSEKYEIYELKPQNDDNFLHFQFISRSTKRRKERKNFPAQNSHLFSNKSSSSLLI